LEPEDDHDPRFSLANERTFLAWNRTALALIAGGIAAARFLGRGTGALPLIVGLGLILLGGYTAWASFRRWRGVERAIRLREPEPASDLPQTLTAGVVVFCLAAIVLAVVLFANR